MTNEQQQRLAAMQGELGDELQFEALLERTQEIVSQSFNMMRVIPSSDPVSILPGKTYFISSHDNRSSMESNDP